MESQLGFTDFARLNKSGGGGGCHVDAASAQPSRSTAATMTTTSTFASYHEPPYPDFTQLTVVHATFVGLYVIVIALSVTGNLLVCLTVFRNKKMHTAVNYYIVNLGLCDLMVGLFVMPVKLLELAAPANWGHLNDARCTATMYLQTVVVFSGVLTLVATCVERYFAIVHPLESRMHHSKSRAKCILLCVWMAPCLVASPFLYPASAQANRLHSDYGVIHRLTCFDGFGEHFRRVYFLLLFLLVYVLPLVFIGGTCAAIIKVLLGGIPFHRQGSVRRQENNRRKVAKMVMMVAVAYVVSWTPYFMVTLVSQLQSDSFLHRGQYLFTMLSINLFAFANSCVNPFIYAAMSVRFRHGFRSIFLLMLCSPREPEDPDRVHAKSDTPSRLSYIVCKSRPGSSSDTPPSSTAATATVPPPPAKMGGTRLPSSGFLREQVAGHKRSSDLDGSLWSRLMARSVRTKRNLILLFRVRVRRSMSSASRSHFSKAIAAAPSARRLSLSAPQSQCSSALNLECLDGQGQWAGRNPT